MPPKKAKEKPLTGEQASDLILEYLRKQNRPYSIIEIVANLHDAVSKTNATKALKDLTERELIKEKVSGKQAIYHITQDPRDAATPEELKEMNLKVEGMRGEITSLKSEKKELETELAALRSAPTAKALQQTMKELKAEIATLSARLGPLRAGTVTPVSPAEKAVVDGDLAKFEKILQKRKKMFKELSELVTEGGEQNKKDLWVSTNLCILIVFLSPACMASSSCEERLGIEDN
ncbi:Tat binding protein 1-interacting protein-domain-containing protein [Terfezia claveryi]|nr:Tat binding protein 1-interacting protein-domain-containing protein [Terfezia claveryi]